MSEFEKEHEKWHRKNNNGYDTARDYHEALREHFKDWQPPKQLVEVSQCVADWFEKNNYNVDGNIKALITRLKGKFKSEYSEFERWFEDDRNKPIETLIRMKLEGYTVKKEPVYRLENQLTGHFLYKTSNGDLNECIEKSRHYYSDCSRFTKSETDELYEKLGEKLGSYARAMYLSDNRGR